MSEDESQHVADRDARVAGAEEDDGALRVAEATSVDGERADGGGGRGETERRPERDPELSEGLLVGREVDPVARNGAVGFTARRDAVVQRAGGVRDGNERSRTRARAVSRGRVDKRRWTRCHRKWN